MEKIKSFKYYLENFRDIRKSKIEKYKKILRKCCYLSNADEEILDTLTPADQYLILTAMIIEEEVLEDKADEKLAGISTKVDKHDPFNEDYTYIKIDFPHVGNVYWYNARSFKNFLKDIKDLREEEMDDKDYVHNFCQIFLDSNYCRKEDVHLIKSFPLLDQRFLINEIHCEMDRHDINLFDI